MKLSIRMKIFLPVMLLLIAFPVAAWFVFSYRGGTYGGVQQRGCAG